MTPIIYKAQKKKRKRVLLTPRDQYLLCWIGEQYAIRRDHLRQLLTRESRHSFQIKGELISEKGVKNVLARWRRAGWVEVQKIFSAEPQWIWLTKKGIEYAGVSYPCRTPSVSKLNHNWHVNAVRLYVEQSKHGQAKWVSERAINERLKNKRRRHMADGEVLFENTLIAVEVELVQKSKKRLFSILRSLKREYKAVWYFVADESYTALINALKHIDKHGQVFVVYRLSDLLN